MNLKIKVFLTACFFLFPNISLFSSSQEDLIEDTISNGRIITPDDFIFGADLSYVNQIEDNGGTFKVDNKIEDVYSIFQEKGANMVRIRIWNNPSWINDIYNNKTPLYSGYKDVEKSIQRAKEQGMAVNLDFHYSDIWADPQGQKAPEAWKQITDINVLCDSVYNYTFSVLSALNANGLLPEMVQIGNETNCGMLYSDSVNIFKELSICNNNWENAGKVFNAGIQAVRDLDSIYSKKTTIALHVADPKNLEWWFSNMTTKGAVTNFDMIGFSYYPLWHTTIGFDELPALVTKLKNAFSKEVIILETAYPFTTEANDEYNNLFGSQTPLNNYPYTPDGQRQFLIDLTRNMKSVGCKGVIYWEPAWITSELRDLWSKGSAWENNTFFDYNGNATKAFDYMHVEYNK